MIDFKKPIFSTKMKRYIKEYYTKNNLFAIFASGVSNMFVDANFIKFCSDGSIGYLPLDKFEKFSYLIEAGDMDPFDDGIGRVKCKPGKFINKYFNWVILCEIVFCSLFYFFWDNWGSVFILCCIF
jgi:hypothetical protein